MDERDCLVGPDVHGETDEVDAGECQHPHEEMFKIVRDVQWLAPIMVTNKLSCFIECEIARLELVFQLEQQFFGGLRPPVIQTDEQAEVTRQDQFHCYFTLAGSRAIQPRW